MSKKTISLQGEYGSSGIWGDGGMIGLEEINMSNKLKIDFKKWMGWYRKQLDWSNPGKGCIFSKEEKKEFMNFEKYVYKAFVKEVGNIYNVKYYPTFPDLQK